MAKRKDIEEIYEDANREYFAAEEIPLGPWTSYSLIHDPKHMCFAISRYKFCSKMLAKKKTIMEVGSGDGFGLPVLAQVAEKIITVDWDKRLLDGNARRLSHLKNVEYIHMDFSFPYLYDVSQQVAKKYSAVCTPDFFGYNKNSELQYRGRILEAKKLKPVLNGDTELRKAMKLIAETGKGPQEQFPSMGCSIKWFK